MEQVKFTKMEDGDSEDYLFLNEHEIQYWLTDGTLLGLIRENRILPWDSDLDLGIWKVDVSIPEIIRIFNENGFQYHEVLPDMDSLHFEISGIELDINFFKSRFIKNIFGET